MDLGQRKLCWRCQRQPGLWTVGIAEPVSGREDMGRIEYPCLSSSRPGDMFVLRSAFPWLVLLRGMIMRMKSIKAVVKMELKGKGL